jgi:hypothetical protein
MLLKASVQPTQGSMGLGVKFVWMGDTAETAKDRIYAVYGDQTSVSNKMNGSSSIPNPFQNLFHAMHNLARLPINVLGSAG